MNVKLVIFDMDGTLVQSENCASQALIDVIPVLQSSAAKMSAQEATYLYRGMRLAEIFEDIERHYPRAIPHNCLELYRKREQVLSSSMITPSAGVETMLSQMSGDRCIASNAPVEKTRRSLEQCGLSHFFENGIFSAYQVQAWKPDATLFLHAAASYDVEPAECLVVEDSEVGIQAAKAAGMTPIFYGPHLVSGCYDGLTRISNLTELLDILA